MLKDPTDLPGKEPTVPPTAEPWERQPGESDPAAEAWIAYRDMGAERSVRAVSRALDKSVTLIGQWSSRHAWPARVSAWDDECDRVHRAAMMRARKDMSARHARAAMGFQAKAIQALQAINVETLSAADALRWWDVAVKIERLALGEPDRLEHSGPGGGPIEITAGLSAAERREVLVAALREAQDRLGRADPEAPAVP